MAFITHRDAPADRYGRVSSVTRPLLHALNQARVHEDTFTRLTALLSWAVDTLETQVREELDANLARAQAKRTTESTQEATFAEKLSAVLAENENAAQGSETPLVSDEASKAEEAWKTHDPQAPLDPNANLGDGEEPETEVAPEVVANPAAKAKVTKAKAKA